MQKCVGEYKKGQKRNENVKEREIKNERGMDFTGKNPHLWNKFKLYASLSSAG